MLHTNITYCLEAVVQGSLRRRRLSMLLSQEPVAAFDCSHQGRLVFDSWGPAPISSDRVPSLVDGLAVSSLRSGPSYLFQQMQAWAPTSVFLKTNITIISMRFSTG